MILIEPHYLPCINYFSILYAQKHISLEVKEHFIKQTFRNRTHILGANGVERLSVPLIKANSKKPFDKVLIDNKANWQNKHWGAIQSAYGKAPFFEFYADYFKNCIYTPNENLLALNKSLLSLCLKFLNLNPQISLTEEYQVSGSEHCIDKRNFITSETNFYSQKYTQVFGTNFTPNLSIIDLLFSEGPNAAAILKLQAKQLVIF